MTAQKDTTEARPPRVAYVVSRFPAITETFILYEILELERRGFTVDVFALLQHHDAVRHREAEVVVQRTCYGRGLSLSVLAAHLHYLTRSPGAYVGALWAALAGNVSSPEFMFKAFFVFYQTPRFARVMEVSGVEHVHAHWATHPALAAFIIQRLTGLPYSFTGHAHDLYMERAMLGEKIAEARFVVTISDFNKRLLETLYGSAAAAKTMVIHCGIDSDVFNPKARPAGPASRPIVLLCVASLRDYKGHSYLVDACRMLSERGVDFSCLLVGEGNQRPALEAQIEAAGLTGKIQLLGAQSRDRVSELMNQCDAMVLPSIITPGGQMEGIPVALMEAMATERPVVATRISGIPELIEDGVTGMLVPEKDAVALANALERLAREPEFGRRLAEAGREKVLREFSLRANAGLLSELFRHDWTTGPPVASVAAGAPSHLADQRSGKPGFSTVL
jgi:colanic acid/amylovoran biosynthesis glycosyltransferase